MVVSMLRRLLLLTWAKQAIRDIFKRYGVLNMWATYITKKIEDTLTSLEGKF